jgi:hypothetical protein
MLKEAVLLLIVFKIFREDEREFNILTRVAEGHAKRAFPSELYDEFGRVLVDVAIEKEKDRGVPPLKLEALRRAWRSVIEPGIQYMKTKKRRKGENDRF